MLAIGIFMLYKRIYLCTSENEVSQVRCMITRFEKIPGRIQIEYCDSSGVQVRFDRHK